MTNVTTMMRLVSFQSARGLSDFAIVGGVKFPSATGVTNLTMIY